MRTLRLTLNLLWAAVLFFAVWKQGINPRGAVLAGIIGLGALVVFLVARRTERKIAALRARRLYPEAGKESDADVLRLLQAGEKTMAVRLHRSLHHAGLRAAKDAVERLERQKA